MGEGLAFSVLHTESLSLYSVKAISPHSYDETVAESPVLYLER